MADGFICSSAPSSSSSFHLWPLKSICQNGQGNGLTLKSAHHSEHKEGNWKPLVGTHKHTLTCVHTHSHIQRLCLFLTALSLFLSHTQRLSLSLTHMENTQRLSLLSLPHTYTHMHPHTDSVCLSLSRTHTENTDSSLSLSNPNSLSHPKSPVPWCPIVLTYSRFRFCVLPQGLGPCCSLCLECFTPRKLGRKRIHLISAQLHSP